MEVEKNLNTEQDFIKGILIGDERVLHQIYEQFYGQVRDFVVSNNGDHEDARDVFQEALKIIFIQTQQGLKITRSFQGYLHLICRRRWYNELKRRKKIEPGLDGFDLLIDDQDAEQTLIAAERQLLFRKHFSELGESCRQILSLIFEGRSSLMEIAEQLNFTYKYVRKRHSQCNKSLTENIRKDPLFAELS